MQLTLQLNAAKDELTTAMEKIKKLEEENHELRTSQSAPREQGSAPRAKRRKTKKKPEIPDVLEAGLDEKSFEEYWA